MSLRGRSRLPHPVELIISALGNDLLGAYQRARRVTAAPSTAFSRSLKLRTTYAELVTVERFLQGKGSRHARRHGRNINQRLIDALESAALGDLVSAVTPWEMSAVQLRRVAATTTRAQRTRGRPLEIIALLAAMENGLARSYKAARLRIPDQDEALMTCLRVHVTDDQWWAVRQFLRSDAGEDAYLHLRAALESADPAHLQALFAPWGLSPGGSPTAEGAGCRRAIRPQLDHYAVLGVGRDATGEAIRTAYKTLCQIYHPDRYHSAPASVVQEAATRVLALNDAYQCLSDKGSRARYDSSVRSP